MKKVFSLLILFLSLSFSFAQQDKQFTHYMFDKMSFNPAATGFKGYCATFIYRNQWDRVERAPNTTLVNLQANIPQQNIGLGISLSNDVLGFQRNNTATLNGAYHLFTNAGILSGGIGVGIINVGFDPDWIPPQTLVDPNLPFATSGTGFDLNLGLHWNGTTLPFYVGISTTHVAPLKMQNINYTVARHYYISAGYDFNLNTIRKIDLKPSILVKADGSTMIFDINTTGNFWINNYSYLWGGFSYRLKDAFAINLGFAFSPAASTRINMMKIGYSFDIMTNPLNPYGKGTHELMLNFCIFPPAPVIGSHGNPFILE